MIQLKDISYSYGDIKALSHIDLEINDGETMVLNGPNGCGKTTLLKILNGLILDHSGTFVFDGEVIDENFMKKRTREKLFHKRIGFVFQNPDVQLFNSTVYDEVAFGPRQMELSEEEIETRVKDCLKLLDIEKLNDRASYQLSGGEKKKVAIASVLSLNPQVLIFDEPLAGLDPKSKAWLLDFLIRLKEANKTMIIATHDEVLTSEIADRVAIFDEDHQLVSVK